MARRTVAAIYTRAQELGEHIDEATSEELEFLKFPVLFGLWLSHLVRAELDAARELGERCIAHARQQQNVALMLESPSGVGIDVILSRRVWRGARLS